MKYEDVEKKAIEEYPDLERLPSTKAIVYAYRYRKEMKKCYTTDMGSLEADARFIENYAKDIRLGKNLSSPIPPLDLPNVKPFQHNSCIRCNEEKIDCIPICFDCFKNCKALEVWIFGDDLKKIRSKKTNSNKTKITTLEV